MMLRQGLGGGRRWLAQLAAQNSTLMHAHFFNDGVDAIRLSQKLGIPLVTTVHGHDITKHDNAGAQIRLRETFFSQVDCVIAVSQFMARQALERGCPENKLRQHYIGIDLEKFKQPKQVILTGELPRNTMGKVQKNALREAYAGLFAG